MTTILSSFYNLGGPGMIIILLIVLLLFGAKRLPELARGLGQAINEFNKAKDDVQRQISRADEPAVKRPEELQAHQRVAPSATPSAAAAAAAAAATPAQSEPSTPATETAAAPAAPAAPATATAEASPSTTGAPQA